MRIIKLLTNDEILSPFVIINTTQVHQKLDICDI